MCPVNSQLVYDLAVVAGAALSLAASLCHPFHPLLKQSWPSVAPCLFVRV